MDAAAPPAGLSVVGVVHFVFPYVMLGCLALAPWETSLDPRAVPAYPRGILLFYLFFMAWWALYSHECPFAVIYKKMRDPAYAVGRNMKVPDLTDMYADLHARYGLTPPVLEKHFQVAMAAMLLLLTLYLLTYSRVPPTVTAGMALCFFLVSLLGAVRRHPAISDGQRKVGKTVVLACIVALGVSLF